MAPQQLEIAGRKPVKRIVVKMTAEEVKNAISRRHGCDGSSGEWVCVNEAFSGYSAYCGGVDVFAIGAWRTAKAPGLRKVSGGPSNPIVSYEVKVSRADMRRELYGYQPSAKAGWSTRGVLPWPGKAEWALAHSHYFMFAVPAGLLSPEEIESREPSLDRRLFVPPGIGLVEVDGRGCRVAVAADPRPEPEPLTPHQCAELIRHAVDPAKTRDLRLLLKQCYDWREVELAAKETLLAFGFEVDVVSRASLGIVRRLRA